MKHLFYKVRLRLILSLLLTFLTAGVYAQVTVTGATAGNGSYSTLDAAFIAINGGVQSATDDIQIALSSSTIETTSTGLSQGLWKSLKIYPTVSGVVIAGNGTSVGVVVRFNGCDRVTLDGRVNGTGDKNMVINNPMTGNTAAIKFQNDASDNTVEYCIIQAASSFTANTIGVIAIVSPTTSGNNNNLIDHCDIGDNASGRPVNGIIISGTSATILNVNNTISNCNIYNVAGTNNTINAIGIDIAAFTNGTKIDKNRIYWTSELNQTVAAGVIYYGLFVTGQNNVITNNVIGYANSDGTGYSTITGNSLATSLHFSGIRVAGGTTSGTYAYISKNTVANIILTTTYPGDPQLTSSEAIMNGIYGDATVSGGYATYENNTIQNLTLYHNVATSSNNFRSLSGLQIITPNSIITGNSINGLTEVGGTVSTANNGFSTQVNGIYIDKTTLTSLVSGNTISNLSSGTTSSTASNNAYGITAQSLNALTLEKNLIYNIAALNNAATAIIVGISIYNNSTQSSLVNPVVVKNNMIRLGTDVSVGSKIYGIYNQNNASANIALNVYNNSVYIGGTISSGVTSDTHAIFRSASGSISPAAYKNNVLVNVRTGGTTGKHYAIGISNATDYTASNLANDYNLYQIGTGSNNYFGLVGATGYVSMTSWTSSCTGFDVHSKNSDPLFVDPASTIPDLRLKANMVSDADQNGLQLASVTDDFFGSIRSGLTPNDIGAFAYVFDNVLPTVNITSTVTSPTSINPIPVKITFSEPVTGFTIDDLSVVNGTLSGFAGNGTTYTVNVIPSGQVVVTIGIAAGVATDPAGNLNSAANQFSITYSTVSSVATVKESASIYGSNSSIVLEGTAGQTAVIYSVTGQTVKSVNLTANRVTVPVNKGIFIVRLGKKNVKVIVK